MKRFTFATLALLLSVCAFPRAGHAAQMALKLDGVDVDSFFAAPDNDALDKNMGSALTVEAWINPAVNLANDTNHSNNEYIILNKEDSYEISVRNDDPATEGSLQVALFPEGGGWEWHDSEVVIPTNKWTHVAATWDGTVIRTFINGKFAMAFDKDDGAGGKGVINFDGGSSAGLSTLKIGRRGRGVEDHSIFNGLIDEVRISKVVRYTEAGFDVPTKAFTSDADTVALYHFDEAITTAADVAALKAKFDAQPTDDNGDGDPDPALDIKAVVKDASDLHNDGALTKNAVLVAADTPITVQPAP
jgi:Concanavalin A-like lectin/glucanases superfamily